MLEREPFYTQAKQIMGYCIRGEILGCLTSHTLLNVYYITRKHKSINERKEILLMLCDYFNIIGINKEMIVDTLKNNEWNDLEDGLQIRCAEIEKVDWIITRDPKGFTSSKINILSPDEFIKRMTTVETK
jgi:predicted nucleic acid-binding protein